MWKYFASRKKMKRYFKNFGNHLQKTMPRQRSLETKKKSFEASANIQLRSVPSKVIAVSDQRWQATFEVNPSAHHAANSPDIACEIYDRSWCQPRPGNSRDHSQLASILRWDRRCRGTIGSKIAMAFVTRFRGRGGWSATEGLSGSRFKSQTIQNYQAPNLLQRALRTSRKEYWG